MSKRSKIEKDYDNEIISYEAALGLLREKREAITTNTENQQSGFYKYKNSARKKLSDIDWQIQRILASEKRKGKNENIKQENKKIA